MGFTSISKDVLFFLFFSLKKIRTYAKENTVHFLSSTAEVFHYLHMPSFTEAIETFTEVIFMLPISAHFIYSFKQE